MDFTLDRRFGAKPAPSYEVFPHQGGVLLVPGMYGTPLHELGPAFWSESGEHFVEAPIDGSAIGLGPTPSLHARRAAEVTPKGFAFCTFGHRMVTMTVGPTVRFEPSTYAPPAESLRVNDLVIDGKGTWWLCGYANGDEAKGRLYSSPEGTKWTLVADKHWALARLIPHGERLIGLHYKQFSEVTAAGLTKLGAAKAHLDDAVVSQGAIVAVGEGLLTVLASGAKRAKYAPSPSHKPVGLLAIEQGVLLAGHEGLFHSADGLEWMKVSPAPVMALVSSNAGAVVVSSKAEVFVVRGG